LLGHKATPKPLLNVVVFLCISPPCCDAARGFC
jgi:hypothetical protein